MAMSESLENIQAECLERLAQGESIEEILAHYPDVAEEIRPFLQMASQLSSLSSQPYLAAKRASRQSFLEQAAAMQDSQQPRPFFVLRRLFVSAAIVAAMLVLIFSAAFAFSTTALPGDTLYGTKRTAEQWRLSLTQNADTILELRARYNEERIREIEALLRAGKTAEVEFEGKLESIAADHWIVAGLTVLIQDQTIIEGTPQLGELVRVNGRTDAGQLFADTMMVLTGRLEIELPEQIPATPSPTATRTRRPTATRLPLLTDLTPTVSATPTSSPEPTATATPSPTVEPTETSLPTPTPEDGNENEGGPNDNDSNENEDNDNESNDNESNDNESNDNESNDNESNDNESNDNESNDNEREDNESNDNEREDNESNDND
jgi:hypothetical protein